MTTNDLSSSWNPLWEEIFASSDWGKYPPEELVRFVARNYYRAPERQKVRILDLGCGTGACTWFLAREGFDAVGIDGSTSAIRKAKERFDREGVRGTFLTGDVLNVGHFFEAGSFDAVIDVGCFQCNRLPAIEKIIDGACGLLKPGGRLFSICVAFDDYSYPLGKEVEERTYVEAPEGPIHGRGLNHYSTPEDLRMLYSRFSRLNIEWSARSFGNGSGHYKNWIVEAEK